ncbi:MAG: hypothetical protein DRG78_02640 [Epsilonproteobacteria bacterium]|nr:MAG: hypothetical protein DRG78_02640 [Campylobacterota bacterium]
MELLLYGAIGIGIFVLYGALSVRIVNKLSNSTGISKLFWFIVTIATLSFIFGSSSSSSGSTSSYNGGGDTDDYDFNCNPFEEDDNCFDNDYDSFSYIDDD